MAIDEISQGFTVTCLVVAALLLTRCAAVVEHPARDACTPPPLDSPACAERVGWGVIRCAESDGTFWELQKSGEWIHSESEVNDAGELEKLCDLAPDGGLVWRVK